MVKFKVNYSAHISRAFVYLDYDRLKHILHAEDKEHPGHILPTFVHHDTSTSFTTAFEEELRIVDNCYTEHMIDLEYHISDAKRLATEYTTESNSKSKAKRKAQEAALKRGLTQIFDKLTKIETYCLLNRTAAIKILKKHDKMAKPVGREPIYDEYILKVNRTRFGGNNKVTDAKQYIEELYARLFCDDIMEEAQGKLRLAKIHTDPRVRLSVTFKIGVTLTLLAWLINYLLMSPRLAVLYFTSEDPSIFIYAVVGGLVIYRWMWGFSVYMWDSVDIDYTLILDLDASKHMPSADEIFSDAGNLSILFMVNVLIFLALRMEYYEHGDYEPSWNSGRGFIALLGQHAYVMPILLTVGTVLRLLYSICQPQSYGVFSSKIFMNLFSAPFAPVELRHTFAADILCSLVRLVSGVMYSACYFYSGSFLYSSDPGSDQGAARFATCTTGTYVAVRTVIYAYPYFIRMMQCLRQRRDFFVRSEQARERREQLMQRGGGTRAKPSRPPQQELQQLRTGKGAPLRVATYDTYDSSTGRISTNAHNHYPRDRNSFSSAGSGEERKQAGSLDYGKEPDSKERERDYFEDPTYIEGTADVENGNYEDSKNDAGRDRANSNGFTNGYANGSSVEGEADGLTNWDIYGRTYRRNDGKTPDGVSSAPVSRSESKDLPVPMLLRLICPDKTGAIIPNSVRQLWLTIWVWPYSYNALRYFLNVCVIVLGAYPTTNPYGAAYMVWYLPLVLISTLYSCYWDVFCDFKLLQCNSTRPLLRDKILYEGNEGFYYFVLVVDPILRFMWTLSFTPYGNHPFLVLFEIARRSLWACVRMELGYIQELDRRR